jgi:hypothetical protein
MPYCYYCGRAQPSTFSKAKPPWLLLRCGACGNQSIRIVGPQTGDIKSEDLCCPVCSVWFRITSQTTQGGYDVKLVRIDKPTESIYSPF